MRAWLVVHVLAAIAGMGPEMAFGMMGPRARRAGGAAAAAVYEAIAAVRARLVLPALALQVVSGIALIVGYRHDVFGELWLLVALILYAVAVLVVLSMLPGSSRARAALAVGTDPGDPALRAVWRRSAIGGSVAGTLLIVVAVLMVWKPSW